MRRGKVTEKNWKSENKPMHLQPVKFIVALVILFSYLKKKGAKNKECLRYAAGKFVYLQIKQ